MIYPTTNYKPSLKDKAAALLELRRRQTAVNAAPIWSPNPDHDDGTPNTQRLAMESKADILGISGVAGWGKTDMCLGIAAMHHHHSVIFRRIFKNLRGIIERSREIYNPDGDKAGDDSYNESLHRWVLGNDRRMVEFEACQYENDKFHQRGRPRDLYVFDEATEFTKSQIEFIIGWNRSAREGQRCRVVLPFNPPMETSGQWVIQYFLPWLAYIFPDKFQHHNPATPGELRWFTTIDGEEVECKNGDPVEHDGKIYKPLSRSFLFGTLLDNPHIRDTNYTSILAAMPEPLRSQLLHGDFATKTREHPLQVIPSAWVLAAQRRWMENPKPLETPLSGVGVDLARGGADSLTIAKRYGNWFAEIVKIPGVEVEDGPAAAAMLYNELKDDKRIGYINMDVIGIGSSPFDSAKALWPGIVNPINASTKTAYVSMSNTSPPIELFKMRNTRAEYHWRLREALDPVHGNDLALPPGNEILADLCAARYKMMADRVIQIEAKDEIKKRIGRSPDVGEAIMMALNNTTMEIDASIYGQLGSIEDYKHVFDR
ncbi:MAG: terminase [Chloroflexi bacterium]|nr:terminase [Chloroflexota bacterium]